MKITVKRIPNYKSRSDVLKHCALTRDSLMHSYSSELGRSGTKTYYVIYELDNTIVRLEYTNLLSFTPDKRVPVTESSLPQSIKSKLNAFKRQNPVREISDEEKKILRL